MQAYSILAWFWLRSDFSIRLCVAVDQEFILGSFMGLALPWAQLRFHGWLCAEVDQEFILGSFRRLALPWAQLHFMDGSVHVGESVGSSAVF